MFFLILATILEICKLDGEAISQLANIGFWIQHTRLPLKWSRTLFLTKCLYLPYEASFLIFCLNYQCLSRYTPFPRYILMLTLFFCIFHTVNVSLDSMNSKIVFRKIHTCLVYKCPHIFAFPHFHTLTLLNDVSG